VREIRNAYTTDDALRCAWCVRAYKLVDRSSLTRASTHTHGRPRPPCSLARAHTAPRARAQHTARVEGPEGCRRMKWTRSLPRGASTEDLGYSRYSAACGRRPSGGSARVEVGATWWCAFVQGSTTSRERYLAPCQDWGIARECGGVSRRGARVDQVRRKVESATDVRGLENAVYEEGCGAEVRHLRERKRDQRVILRNRREQNELPVYHQSAGGYQWLLECSKRRGSIEESNGSALENPKFR